MGACDNPRLRCKRGHTLARTHARSETHKKKKWIATDCHLCPSLEKGKDVKLQGVTCTELSSFLNVNKQLGEEREKERGGGSMIWGQRERKTDRAK